ncbi:HaeIII family restriction endonuclease [Paenibacillus typhae]|uniref:HaeIII restriction endonuclease n=1 Tax=Paenibacillus typhae TaxID=1174501 RepID=A0A1G8MMI5_9BACL|nr:HaeIII family restriction endonuclease [Paenibacillus typhae]SDI69114.1 HaeIII restriction endonuclease [Paenibacillus typhae]
MAKNTDRGYGFEYVNILVAHKVLGTKVHTNTLSWMQNEGRNKLHSLTTKEQNEMVSASTELMKFLKTSESWLTIPGVTVERVRGKVGSTDVSDILFKKVNALGEIDKELGISLKSNHEAVKHQRISDRIDIGEKWLGVPSGKQFMKDVNKIFTDFRTYCSINRIERYDQLGDQLKDSLLYRPICTIVKKLLDDTFSSPMGSSAVSHFMNYLIGSKDFYKAVASFKEKELKIISFNLRGGLGKGKILRSPQRCLDIKIQSSSDKGFPNRVHIILDNGWEVNLRVHNASSRIESSLKWDSQLVGIPSDAWQTRIGF